MSNKSINDGIKSAIGKKSRSGKFTPGISESHNKVNEGIRTAWKGGNGQRVTERIVEGFRKKTDAAAVEAAKKAAQANTIDAPALRDEVQKMVDDYLISGVTGSKDSGENEEDE